MLKKLKRLFFGSSRNYFSKYLSIDGWLTEAEAGGLFEIAKSLHDRATVVEIGSWKGKSTWCIAQGLGKGTINCIDPFNAAGEEGSKEIYEKTKGEKPLIEQFHDNMKGISSSIKINTLQGYSSDFVNKVTDIDFLFIDGDHSIEGCKFDFVNYAPALKPGGFLAFHDYYPERDDLGSTWVIKELVEKDMHYSHYKTFDSLCVFRKNS